MDLQTTIEVLAEGLAKALKDNDLASQQALRSELHDLGAYTKGSVANLYYQLETIEYNCFLKGVE